MMFNCMFRYTAWCSSLHSWQYDFQIKQPKRRNKTERKLYGKVLFKQYMSTFIPWTREHQQQLWITRNFFYRNERKKLRIEIENSGIHKYLRKILFFFVCLYLLLKIVCFLCHLLVWWCVFAAKMRVYRHSND